MASKNQARLSQHSGALNSCVHALQTAYTTRLDVVSWAVKIRSADSEKRPTHRERLSEGEGAKAKGIPLTHRSSKRITSLLD